MFFSYKNLGKLLEEEFEPPITPFLQTKLFFWSLHLEEKMNWIECPSKTRAKFWENVFFFQVIIAFFGVLWEKVGINKKNSQFFFVPNREEIYIPPLSLPLIETGAYQFPAFWWTMITMTIMLIFVGFKSFSYSGKQKVA